MGVGRSGPGMLTRFTLLWLVGVALRLTLLAVPPLIPLMHADLALSETEVGVLTSLPVFLFAAAAVPGSLLIARLGVRNAVLVGLFLVAAASAARGALDSAAVLFAATFFMGIGIALLQPAMPTLVNDWFPTRAGVATAVYTNGLLVGETLGAGLTLPLVLPLAQGSWRLSLALWSLPILATAVALALATRGGAPTGSRTRRWWPDWADKRTWQLGLIMGGGSSLYFAANTFLPDFLHASGREAYIAASLTALNLSQIPAPLLILFASRRLVGRRLPLVIIGLITLLSLIGIILGGGGEVVACAAILGFGTAFILTLGLALPALLVAPEQVHRLSAAMFAISYGCAVVLPVIGGVLWDATALPQLAFVPGILGALLVIGFGAVVRLGRPYPGSTDQG